MVEYTNSMIRSIIEEHIHSEKDRTILCRRLIDGWTYREIAELVEMDESTCRRKVYKLQNRIFKHFP
jgi:DNA-directed RNA polymerase specialized sigma24 family protein